jgi:hypothetical protein
VAESRFSRLAGEKGYLGRIFKIITSRYVADSKRPAAHTPGDIAEIRDALWQQVQENHIEAGVDYKSPNEMLDALLEPSRFRQLMSSGRVKDDFTNVMAGPNYPAYSNWVTGAGTPGDPGTFNVANMPILMAPFEASAYYANGGIPQIIIDKKAKGILLNGYGFEGDGWSPDECKTLHDYAERMGFGESLVDGARDGLVHGGSLLYPVFKKDTPLSTPQSIEELLKAGILGKDSINHFAVADRWNCVLVPNWDITAEDYIYPRTIYVPIGGVEVATKRAALIRPRKLDYWGMLQQIGWTTSEFQGWIRPMTGYEIIIASIPIMAQQMSLLVHEFPLDSMVVQDGVKAAKKFIQENIDTMRQWSFWNPVTINSFGELKTLERHYEGFDALVAASRQHVSAACGIPESVIWSAQPKGLASANESDVLLKQSEVIQLFQRTLAPQLAPIARVLAISCFGSERSVLDRLPSLKFTFESPVVMSATEMADSGAKFATVVQTLAGAQVPLDVAFECAKLFFPDVEIPREIMDRLTQVAETDLDSQQFALGMEEVQRRWGSDIVQRLSQRMAERGNGKKAVAGYLEKQGMTSEEPEGEEAVKAAVAAKLAQDAAAAEAKLQGQIDALRAELTESNRTFLERIGASFRRFARRNRVRDKSPGTIVIQPHITTPDVQPHIEVRPEIRMPDVQAPTINVTMPKAPEVRMPPIQITMPPINVDARQESKGSVSVVDYQLDENGRIKPGTVKITKTPLGNGKKEK